MALSARLRTRVNKSISCASTLASGPSTMPMSSDSRIEKLLSNAGYQVTTAVNGQAALDAVKQAKPDCVVMDVNMPVMDGFAAFIGRPKAH